MDKVVWEPFVLPPSETQVKTVHEVCILRSLLGSTHGPEEGAALFLEDRPSLLNEENAKSLLPVADIGLEARTIYLCFSFGLALVTTKDASFPAEVSYRLSLPNHSYVGGLHVTSMCFARLFTS
jgi:hypothetical protein